MGNCVTVLKTQCPDSKLKCSSFSRTECILTERPIPEDAVGTAIPRVSSFQDPNGKEVVCFCPDPLLESDSEDFFSVRSDLTPTGTNNPIQESSIIETPKISLDVDQPRESSDVKKQLIDLFSDESGDPPAGHQDLHYESDAESSISDLPQHTANRSPAYDQSVADIVFRSVTIPTTNISNPREKKAAQFVQCSCLPKLIPSLSFSERKRR